MAIFSKKSKDPTEVALSAIQDALSVRDAEQKASLTPQASAIVDPVAPAAPQGATGEPFSLNPGGGAPAREEEPSAARRAANDDRAAIGQILQSLQRRPTRKPYAIASLFSLAWVICALGVAYSYAPEFEVLSSQGAVATPLLIGLASIFCAPIGFFFVLAHLLSRSLELRMIAQSMAEVAVRLVEPQTVARDSIVSVGQAIRREVAAMGDGVERALSRAAELETLVNNEVASLERTYSDNEVRIRGLLDSLTQQREAFASQAEQVRNAINSVRLDLTHDIAQASEAVTERINEASQQITTAFGTASDGMLTSINERGGQMLDRLGSASTETATAITAASQQLAASLNFKSEHIGDEFAEISSSIQEMMSSRLDKVIESFSQKSEEVLDAMESRSRNLTSAIVDTSSRLAETIAVQAGEVNSTLKSTGDSLILDLNLRGTDVASKLEQAGSKMTHVLTERLQSFESTFAEGSTKLADRVTQDTSSLGQLIAHHLAEFERSANAVTGKAVEITGSFDQRLARFEEALDNRTQTLSDALNVRIAEVAQSMNETGKDVVAGIENHIADATGTIATHGEAFLEILGARLGDVEARTKTAADLLNNRMEQFADSVQTNAGSIERSLGALSTSTADAIRSSASEMERSLTSLSSGVTTVLKQNASEVERTLLGVSSEVARNFVGRADEIAAAVSSRSAELTRILDDKSGNLISAISGKSSEFTEQVTRVTDAAVKAIEAKGFAFTSTMMDNSEQLARIINDAGENATQSVNNAFQNLQEASRDTIEKSKQIAESAVAEMLETQGILRSDTSTLFERLREANVLLQQVMSGAQENMGALERTLSVRVGQFVGTMNQVMERTGTATGQMDEFHSLTSKMLGDLGELASHFEGQGRALASAVELLEKSNRRTEDSVNDRRVTLDSLVSTLDLRTEDLDQRLQRFSKLLDDSLSAAEGRARDIARVVAESTTDGVRTISEQYDMVRASADEERKRTALAMRQVYEQTAGDAHAIFRDSMERFTEIVESMKRMSADMQRELDTTRQELRRGVLELPQETAESAAQMRRVIVDQIEALAELNRIVARHGRGLDAAAEAPRRGAEPLLAVVGGGRGEVPRSNTTNAVADSSPPATGSSSQRGKETTASRSGSSNTGGRDSWLSNLLKRASHEPEPPDDRAMRGEDRPPMRGDDRTPREDRPVRGDDRPQRGEDRSQRHTLESLDSLAVDIARMIDHDAATELWDRYNRGERNVFTRRLYTMQGQKTFDEIRKRYRADREFKQTVDRYISEFERLLEEVSRDDRGQLVVRTYLTSETGKVYTMLAHAAGRID
jgi:hypothetical protein